MTSSIKDTAARLINASRNRTGDKVGDVELVKVPLGLLTELQHALILSELQTDNTRVSDDVLAAVERTWPQPKTAG
jgi:hypothetical protein